ncbi:colorectal mutant cancer protein-like [Lycorma delicatula]|uniref:colorectal mutant cancer protein-like n=1 Tax=Lycorma delicatula TaxID=130591 RepID=UPI003F518B46
MTEHERNSACSEDNSSVCEDERIRKLFQACGGDGDGNIDSQDLISICRELNLEGSVEELLHELCGDSDGRVPFNEFLRRRAILRHDIDTLNSSQSRDYPTSSNNSQGAPSGSKNERWEFDSGARDLSPEPHTLQKLMEVAAVNTSSNTANLLHLANKLHLAALASLRGEILDLSSRLQAVTEERDLLEKSLAQAQSTIESSVAQQYEDRLTKLQCIVHDLSCKLDDQPRTLVMPEEEHNIEDVDDDDDEDAPSVETERQSTDCCKSYPEIQADELPESNSNDAACSTTCNTLLSCKSEELKKLSNANYCDHKLEELKQNVIDLQTENSKLQVKLNSKDIEIKKLRTYLNSNFKEKHCKVKENHYRKGEKEGVTVTPSHQNPPVPKVAERVRLRRTERHITGSDITSLGVSHTEVAEHLVSSVLEQCDLLELGNDQRKFEIETERLISKLEHTRAFNTLLQSSLEEMKSHSERLTLLVGKYENNAIALQLALSCCDRIIRVYEELITILFREHNENFKAEEKHLLHLIDDLKQERTTIEGTVVQLESYVESPAPQPQIPTLARKLDLETAVLIQEVMSMREEKADLNATIYRLEKEKESLELKLATMETQQQTQLATVQHLKMLNESIPENQEQFSEGQKEKILRDQLREMAATLERVSRNAEVRQKQHAEMMVELRTTNCTLLKNLEKNKHKYEARLHKLEAQMLTMVSRHAGQVQTLKQRILQLLDNKNNDQQW